MIDLAKVVYRARNITTLDIRWIVTKTLGWSGDLYKEV